jgi:hypothetical protein
MSPPARAIMLFWAMLPGLLEAQTGAKGKGQSPASQPAPARNTTPLYPTPIPPAPIPTKMGPPAPELKLVSAVAKETFTYGAAWRLIRAGTVTLESIPSNPGPSKVSMRLESAGLVASLFKVNDLYTASYEESFCATTARLESNEGKRQRDSLTTYERAANRAHFLERDLITGTVLRESRVDIAPCTSDVVGALFRLRAAPMEPGTSTQAPVSDGRRAAMVKVEAQEREEVKVPAGTFKAIRYEAGILNGVIYPRKGKAFIWFSDDARHIPVQIRLRMSFPVGTVTLELEKQEGP